MLDLFIAGAGGVILGVILEMIRSGSRAAAAKAEIKLLQQSNDALRNKLSCDRCAYNGDDNVDHCIICAFDEKGGFEFKADNKNMKGSQE